MRVKMKHMDLVVLEHHIDDSGEGRKQASLEGVNEERDLGDYPSHARARCRPGRRLSPLVEVGGEHGAHLAHGLVVEHPRPAESRLEGWGTVGEDRVFFPLSACFGAMTVKRAEHWSD